MIDIARPLAHFVAFTAILRRASFAVAPEQTMAWLAAIDLLGPEDMGDIRRAARATLAPPPERFAEFETLFDAHFLGAVDAARESGAKATRAERLSTRRFAPAAEDATLRRFTRALPASAPRRRGYRWREAHNGHGTDVRRMLRDAMRNVGEFVRLRHRRRRLRPRRIVLLIDISGSMKELTQTHLAFAHALARAADAVEVFTFGTRLTRITRALRLRD